MSKNAAAAIIAGTWKTTAAVKLAISAAAAATPAALTAGNAVLICDDADCYILVAPTPVATIASGGYHIFLPAGLVWPIFFDGLDKVSAITALGSGNLHICYPQ